MKASSPRTTSVKSTSQWFTDEKILEKRPQGPCGLVNRFCIREFPRATVAPTRIAMAWRRNWVPVGVLVVLLYFATLIGLLTETRYPVTLLPALSVAAAIGFTEMLRRKDDLAAV